MFKNVERENDMISFIFSICDMIGDVSCNIERCGNNIKFELFNPDTRRHYNMMMYRDEFAEAPEEKLEAGKEEIRKAILNKLLRF